ncbi:hypothetical protein DY245_24250 [Streptomyces inhibens]|uniref:Methyltransferase domain-containing protein n=1 Tax=Streptomyces inhibens TaxID=2293571 RepID=A0A371PZL3_STRIH|nr:hypothetical protein [Streptomyces inhibens]REK87895.1 hypothetical protein DY245_24250 [Streptomyces inhibens]
MGRWSRLVAEEFTAWLNCADGLRCVDVGCGTGVLSAVVTARCHPRLMVGIELLRELLRESPLNRQGPSVAAPGTSPASAAMGVRGVGCRPCCRCGR